MFQVRRKARIRFGFDSTAKLVWSRPEARRGAQASAATLRRYERLAFSSVGVALLYAGGHRAVASPEEARTGK